MSSFPFDENEHEVEDPFQSVPPDVNDDAHASSDMPEAIDPNESMGSFSQEPPKDVTIDIESIQDLRSATRRESRNQSSSTPSYVLCTIIVIAVAIVLLCLFYGDEKTLARAEDDEITPNEVLTLGSPQASSGSSPVKVDFDTLCKLAGKSNDNSVKVTTSSSSLKRFRYKNTEKLKLVQCYDDKHYTYDIVSDEREERVTHKKLGPDCNFDYQIEEIDDLAKVAPGTKARGARGGRSLGLIISCSYPGTAEPSQLNGTYDDGRRIKKYLEKKNFDVTWMEDKSHSPGDRLCPTRKNMEKMIRSYPKKLRSGDAFFFHYAGHGTDGNKNTKEADGKDEAMCPSDCATAGLISDDWLTDNFINKIPGGVEVVVMFDCCRSGSLLDLPYTFTHNKFTRSEHPKTKLRDGSTLLYLSGCDDSQCSYETQIEGKMGGVLTSYFLNLVREKGDSFNIGEMITFLTQKAHKQGKSHENNQTPTLSCSRGVTPETKFTDFFDGITVSKKAEKKAEKKWDALEKSVSGPSKFGWFVIILVVVLVLCAILISVCCCCGCCGCCTSDPNSAYPMPMPGPPPPRRSGGGRGIGNSRLGFENFKRQKRNRSSRRGRSSRRRGGGSSRRFR